VNLDFVKVVYFIPINWNCKFHVLTTFMELQFELFFCFLFFLSLQFELFVYNLNYNIEIILRQKLDVTNEKQK